MLYRGHLPSWDPTDDHVESGVGDAVQHGKRFSIEVSSLLSSTFITKYL